MWYNVSRASGHHYGFRAMGFNTRHVGENFQVYIDSLSELNRLSKIFNGGIVLNASGILILDVEYWLEY